MPATLETPESTEAEEFGAAVHHDGDFPEDKFVNIANVPVFAEHSTTTDDGRQLRFGYAELKAVCDRCNRRIADTGDYAAISIGHTPSPEAKAKGAAEPDFVGLAGPFRMGTLGNGDRVRHAILCDFHVYREDYHKLRKYPRRSPELWLEDTFDEMFLDPIALLGAEAPRLDMGLLYSAVHRGRQKLKYSAVSPGPANASLPSTAVGRYSGDLGMNGMPGEATTPDQGQDFMAMFEQSEIGQFIKALMAERAAGGTDGSVPAAATEEPTEVPAVTPDTPAPPAAPAPAGDPAATPPAPPAPPAGDDGPDAEKELYAAMDGVSDEDLAKYMSHRKSRGVKPYQAEPGEGDVEGEPISDGEGDIGDLSTPEAGTIGYSRNGHRQNTLHYARQIRSLTDQNAQLTKRANDLEARVVNAERKSLLTGMVADGYPINPDEEIGDAANPGRLHYSRCGEREFNDHMQFILDKVARAPLDAVLQYSRGGEQFALGRPNGGPKEKYSAEQKKKAYDYCKKQKMAGQDADYTKTLEAMDRGELVL